MITVSREFADRVAEVAQLLEGDDIPDEALHRLTALAAELVPGGTAAAVTIAMASGALIFAASDRRLEELHRVQFDGDGDGDGGPVVETLRHNEPRRVDDTTAEGRWPTFCRAAAEAGFASCLVLPLRTDRQPAGAVALYGPEPNVFRGAAHDIAMLVAAQGGTAVHNAGLYRTCRRMVESLHTGLESRAVIEQAKGMLHAELGVSPAEAFRLLSRYSQNTNQRVRKISAALVQGQIAAAEFRPLVPGEPQLPGEDRTPADRGARTGMMPAWRGSTGAMRHQEVHQRTDHDDDRLTSRRSDVTDTAERAGREVASAGREVASSRWMRGLARAGLLARGVNYLLVGSLAVQIALGSSGTQADTTGALRAVARHPGGVVVLWLLAAGFAGLAVWRFAESVYGQAGPGGQAAPKRLASLALGLLYSGTCGIVVNFILGAGGNTSSDTESKNFTARLLAHSGGQVLVAGIGVAAAAAGVGMGIYGLRRMFATYLRTARMSAAASKVVEGLGVAGYVTRGVVFCIAGAFLIDAAVSFDPQDAQGLDGSLRKTVATPLGPWLLVAIALGLVIFGLYSWCEARWRMVEPG